jgi:hypothetical protein
MEQLVRQHIEPSRDVFENVGARSVIASIKPAKTAAPLSGSPARQVAGAEGLNA